MPASIAGVPGRAGRIGLLDDCRLSQRLARRRPCHAQAAFAGEQGGRPLGSPFDTSVVGRFPRKNVNEKIDFRGFALRDFPLWLRPSLLSPPHGLRPNAPETRANQCYAPEFSRMPGNSHSQIGALSPVFSRNGMVRFSARMASWRSGKERRQGASGWFSNHPTPCRPTIRQSLIRAFASSSACWRDKPRANSSKLNGSARPATVSPIRETGA